MNDNYTLDLQSVGLSQTSKGVLLKWTDNNIYYKSGSLHYGKFKAVEPVIECICSEIIEKLGFKGIKYKLHTVKSRGCNDFDSQDILCCASENFLQSNETLVTFGKHYKRFKNKITYNQLLSDFPQFEGEINHMLIFDFIVNNIDRHFNNFGYIINGNAKYCPIFDNGLSLYSDLNLDEIKSINKNSYAYKKFDKAKPFANKHYSQISLVKNLPSINFHNSNKDFIDILYKYDAYLDGERLQAMAALLERRLNHVRKIYANV